MCTCVLAFVYTLARLCLVFLRTLVHMYLIACVHSCARVSLCLYVLLRSYVLPLYEHLSACGFVFVYSIARLCLTVCMYRLAPVCKCLSILLRARVSVFVCILVRPCLTIRMY